MDIFGLKKMVKSGLEKFILKFHVPFQSCCCPVQKKLPRKAELAWQISRNLWRGSWNFKTIFLDHFSPSFKAQNGNLIKSLFHLFDEFVCLATF